MWLLHLAQDRDTRKHLQEIQNGLGNLSRDRSRQVLGTVKWFYFRYGNGFIICNDIREDIFVDQTAITRNNPHVIKQTMGKGETAKFDIVAGEKGREDASVTGRGGKEVQGSPYAADRCRFWIHWILQASSVPSLTADTLSGTPMTEIHQPQPPQR